MNYSIYRVSLDMHDTSSQVMLNVKQGDSARKIYISLTDGGRPYKITEDCSARLRAKTTANAILFNDCTIKDNIIEYTLTNETCKNVGIVECEVTLYGANGQKITSARFSLIVEGVITSDNEIEATNEFTALTNALARVGDAESKKNKVETITDDATNEQYPSVKAVKDYVDNNAGGSAGGGGLSEEEVYDIADRAISDFTERENPEWQGNKTTLIDENADDISYPSASAVKNYVEGQVGDIETALDSIIAIQEELIGGGGGTREITFTIDGISYTAERGMNWYEWCDSEYNTIEAYVSEESERIYYVIDDEEWQLRDSSDDDVLGSDKIIADELYTGVM